MVLQVPFSRYSTMCINFTSQVDVIDKLCYIIMYCLTSIYRSGFIWILAYLYLAQHLRAALKLMVVSKVLYFFISVFNSLLTLHFFNDVHVSIYIYIYIPVQYYDYFYYITSQR